MTSQLTHLTVKQLKQALRLRKKIEVLEVKMNQVTGGAIPTSYNGSRKRRRKMSASARAKIGAAQKLRWAKRKGEKVEKSVGKTRRKMSAAAKARISAAAKKRWAKARAAGKDSL
jgi:hypothetical protein